VANQIQKKDKSIQFGKIKNKIQTINDLQEIKERGEPLESIEIW
jgi:CCR4-NOT transcription complex subunit 1